jgi:hypothetical protein
MGHEDLGGDDSARRHGLGAPPTAISGLGCSTLAARAPPSAHRYGVGRPSPPLLLVENLVGYGGAMALCLLQLGPARSGMSIVSNKEGKVWLIISSLKLL